MKVIIHPFPAPGDSNMFLKLFYNQVHGYSLKENAFEVKPQSLSSLVRAGRPARDEKHVIHLHWEAVLYGSKFILKSLALMALNFSLLAVLKHIYGMKVIWTMHNTRSHDYPHPAIDRYGQRTIFALADGVIIMQRAVYESWHARYPQKEIRYIPLGNYIGAYPEPPQTRAEIRARFGLSMNDLVLLSFGTAKPYKKIEHIIEVFRQTELDPRLKLCIVGVAKDQYAKRLEQAIGHDPRIIFKNEFTKDSDVAGILEMADYSVFWYDDTMLTSAGVNLSLSYGVPVIVRDIPAADRVREGVNGFLFHDAAQLAAIFKKLPEVPPQPRDEIIHSIAGDDWAVLAPQFMDLCLNL